jgi:hypothetical protein
MNEQENEALSNFSIEDEAISQDFQKSLEAIELDAPKIEEEIVSLRGTLIDFLEHIQSSFQSSGELIRSSSTIEEMQEQHAQLKYRRAWLQSLLHETDREIKIISQVIASKE